MIQPSGRCAIIARRGQSMFDLDQNRLLGALTSLVIALFLASGVASFRARRGFRRAAIAVYVAALAAVLVLVGLWLAGIRG
jgi:hypothetical protein